MIDFLNKYWGFSIGFYAFLSICDRVLTTLSVKLFKKYLSEHFVHQHGYEMNPDFEVEITKEKWFSKKYALRLLLTCVFLAFLYVFEGNAQENILSEFFLGFLVLTVIHVDLIHFQNIAIALTARNPNCIKGRIEISYSFSQKSSAFASFSQAAVYLLAALAVERAFFWGGVISCIILSIKHLNWAKRKFPQEPDSADEKLNVEQAPSS